jgi:protein-S-isoprenylcysteine O-methyltransferase
MSQNLKILFLRLQDVLDFEGGESHPQFSGNAIGKMGTAGFALGVIGGLHAGIFVMSALYVLFVRPEQGDSLEEGGTQTASTKSMFTTGVGFLLQWSVYVVFLCIFHFAEFFITAVKQPKVLSYKSYLINHSVSYTMANIAAWFEFFVESYFFGATWKHSLLWAVVGASILMVGQGVRSAAMWQCGGNFAHEIMTTRTEGHQLVTAGIYSVFRHPAYFGWFYWSIGTQILLCNPVCTLAYAYVSWNFFSKRIPYEEELLLRFYKEKYAAYTRTSIIGIPLIKSPGG